MFWKVYKHRDTRDQPGWHAGLPCEEEYKAGYIGKSHKVVRYPYIRRYASGTEVGYDGSGYYYMDKFNNFAFSQSDIIQLQNRVVSKFEGKCGPSGSVGSSIFAEGKESVQLAVQRLEDMARIARAIRRKDIKKLKKIWRKPTRATTAMKQAGGNWLEFSFGWGPLVQTVFDGIAATGADFPPAKVFASARAFGEAKMYYAGGDAQLLSFATQFIKIGYDVHVSNPNKWLLGRLDLLNPGMWIWEAIPYSFFVDYFINIGDMIHNLDSFAGLSFSNGYTTTYHQWDDRCRLLVPQVNGYPPEKYSKGYCLMRSGPTPLRQQLTLLNNPLTSSWRRGLNASSFLAQRLK